MIDKLIDLFKWIVSNWKLIVPILAFMGIVGGYSMYSPIKPVEPPELDIKQIQPPSEITPPVKDRPPQEIIVREVVREIPQDPEKVDYSIVHSIAEQERLEHEKQYHFQ